MFFYSPNVAPQPSSTSHRRPTLTHQHHLHVGHLDTRLSVQIPEILSRSLVHDPERTRLVPEQLRFIIDENQELWTGSQPPTGFLELCASPVSSVFSNADARRMSQRKLVLRRPTISIQEDGKIIIDHVTARWEGANINSQSALLDADDGATVITDTIKDDQDDKEPKSCPQQTVKYIKILTPHVILVSVLIGYLCLGAWILMLLETRTELLARSKKLVRLTNLMSNFTAESWKMLNNAQHGVSNMDEGEWAATFREWMVRVSETVDDRRPIRRELNRPDDLSNMHNKWTFPTAILYVLTVLTTCGYGEVSVDTDVGKVFSVAFALVGIPLMFITAADIGKFLSETLLQFVSFWNRSVRKVKQWMSRIRHGRRKSLQSTGGPNDTLDILGVDGTEEKLWFPIGAYVSCICIYCSIGSAMFITWERTWSFIHAFHFGFNLIVTVGLGDIVVTDYIFLSLIVAFVIVGLSVVTMCVDLASTHLKAYFTRIHYFGRAKRFLGMSEELKEIVALLGAMRRKKGGKVTWNDVRDFLDNELRDRPFEPHELLMKLRFIDETSSGMSTIRHNSFQSDFFRESEYIRRVAALRPEQPAYL
ncbi:Uncoordinated protein 58 [Caenorhabditis elegans]|uniref:Uncoordinated protein 58 n=1 Tax=Caenorhabditis elegans TaxID=6239 RepID=UNC58_CAEEL|nr:Uncoordinated protein 58 [Caenorhabditis elegans]Q22271.2 RecName: Full=Uncoordinated protein 58 [Caenorhabditis elegans]CAA90066.2 Uncoordinated protein 58 [Caenorhabditis elegans]|eukprot:NP_741881.1 Uncoordinated protein 58 [Caenorhabditis elegans]